ncbi:MAG: PD-(D/E)XK nuclease family protein [Bacteroidia bacterium]|nr:PD-(D/E)XK nuclease family protein [Bacteroidia bacterium]
MNVAKKQTALHLLDNITIIRNKYDEIAKITGENFNIFTVLHLESDEVRLHSRLIGELLNPKGSHNQKGLFLKLFISCLGLEELYTDEQIKNAQVIIEENIGGISDDYTKGGRIDLVIKFADNYEIVIENKIWAGDQPYQLARYFSHYPKATIVYLTPHGGKPSNESLGKITNESGSTNLTILDIKNVKCISYQNEIIKWLEACHKEVYKLPLVREVFSHYINVINKLTNKTNFHQMNDDISKLIIKDITYYKSANDLVNTFNIINEKLYADAQAILKGKFFKKYGEQFKIDYNKHFDNNLVFFTYKEYVFRLRLAEEDGISIWLAPDKKGSSLGVANDEAIIHFKNYFEPLKNSYNVVNNVNYTAWIISKHNFLNWDIENKFNLTNPDFVDTITDDIIEEIDLFINTFKEKAIKENIGIVFSSPFN